MPRIGSRGALGATVAAALLLFLYPLLLADVEQSGRSVVQVTAVGCGGESRSASGFAFGGPGKVVTAQQAVDGCSSVSVYYQSAQQTRRARLGKMFRYADLSLLEVQDAPPVPALQVATAEPAPSTHLIALGYPHSVPTWMSTSLTLRYGGKRLHEILPAKVKSDLERLGSPNVQIDILNLEGHLLHGSSGSPVLDDSGRVVGVANGGLEAGAVEISWAIPQKYLANLLQSEEVSRGPSRLSDVLFSADLQKQPGTESQPPAVAVRCGSLPMTKVRTRTFEDIARYNDDQLGLSQLTSQLLVDPRGFRFDIYEHLASGATAVIPTGARLSSGPQYCSASSPSGQSTLRLTLLPVSSIPDLGSKFSYFEMQSADPSVLWQIDPRWSYFAPFNRFDGLTVKRTTLLGSRMMPPPYGWVAQKALFETLCARNGVFLGISIVNHEISPDKLQFTQNCLRGFAHPSCPAVVQDYTIWESAVIGVAISTFPIG
jgi:hypothetical protein